MFSDMKKPILPFVFRKKYCKVYKYMHVIVLGWFPYGDIWADVELSSLWVFL